MSKNTRIIILSILAVLIVVVLSIGITTAFMKPVEQGGNLTEISLSSCAKIKLTGTSSINLSNSYSMSRNRGLQTTPYSLTVTSYCDSYVGFNLYIATLNTNTLDASNIHYILTNKGSKDVIMEGILSEATNGVSDFDDVSKTELNTGLKGTYGNIYKIYNDSISLKGNKEYDLYLFVDENATNTTMGKKFSAGVAVKAYDRESNLADWVIAKYTGVQGENNIYYHDLSLTNGAGDNSYRYAGSSDTTNNFVCFGTDASTCPTDNLYRIIGVIDGKVKLMKYDYNTKEQLGEDGDYAKTSSPTDAEVNGTYRGALTTLDLYYWNGSTQKNNWDESLLNKTNLNTNFINYLGTTWANKIATTTWKVGGNTWSNIGVATPSAMYTNEITSPVENTIYSAKIGLIYLSDYGFASTPSEWTLKVSSFNNTTSTSNNWMYMGNFDWTILRRSDVSENAYHIRGEGNVFYGNVTIGRGVRTSFYLESSVAYVSGTGTSSDPIRIN